MLVWTTSRTMIECRNWKYSGEKLHQCKYVDHRRHVTCCVIQLEPLRWEAGECWPGLRPINLLHRKGSSLNRWLFAMSKNWSDVHDTRSYHYLVHKTHHWHRIISQLNAARTSKSCLFIIFSPATCSLKLFLPFRLLVKFCMDYSFPPYKSSIPQTSHPSWSAYPDNVPWRVHVMKLLFMHLPSCLMLLSAR
jgi:hypothetical protein